MTLHSRQYVRKTIRTQRRLLSSALQQQASADLVEQANTLAELQNAQHIAIYLSSDGELDTLPLIKQLWQQNKSVYLPVIHPFSSGNLLFLRYQPNTEMTLNRYKISEPKLKKDLIIPVDQLDIIFTPLVAFDTKGKRLGMGGGYYDRTLSTWFKTGIGATPIGLAHDCQRVDALPNETWDIPLPKIITPSKIWTWD
ncbi:5-formyltetrahydrofolate cyclo-ligase [Vibrio sp. WJH972]